jgi:hypothetical protein
MNTVVCPDCIGRKWVWDFRSDRPVRCPTCDGRGTITELARPRAACCRVWLRLRALFRAVRYKGGGDAT